VVIIVILALVVLYLLRHKTKKRRPSSAIKLQKIEVILKGIGGTTMVDTVTGAAVISLPGYLLVEYGKDLRVEKQIAVGGEATIFSGMILSTELRAKFGKLCDSVAIKEMKKKPNIDDKQNEDRFNQEVSVLAALSFHPNIVSILCYTNPPLCLVTPLYEGSFRDMIHKKENKYTSLDLADLVYQILSALNAIHNKDIAHCDIKPGNILLEKRPPRASLTSKTPGEWSAFPYKVRIGDFGVCYLNQTSAKVQIEVVNSRGLSVPYAAPEVFGILASTQKILPVQEFQYADVYSFGVTLWEILHRELPWNGLNNQSIQDQVRSGNRPKIRFNNTVSNNRMEARTSAQLDNKMLFFVSTIEACWNQDSYARPFFRDLLKQFRGLMDLEAVPSTQTDL